MNGASPSPPTVESSTTGTGVADRFVDELVQLDPYEATYAGVDRTHIACPMHGSQAAPETTRDQLRYCVAA